VEVVVADVRKRLKKGVLIALEGIDGAGKTTQARNLYESLRQEGYTVHLLKEPTDGPWGKKIRSLALNGRTSPKEELELFLHDRKEDVEKNIQPGLDRKEIVIMDRYYFSSIAYQGALGIEPTTIRELNERFAPKPNITIILEIAPHVGISRIENGRGEDPNHFEHEDYLQSVGKIFRSIDDVSVQRIDGTRKVDDVTENVLNIVKDVIRPFEV